MKKKTTPIKKTFGDELRRVGTEAALAAAEVALTEAILAIRDLRKAKGL